MAKHSIVRLDNMSGTTDGTLLRSVRYNGGSTDADIDNGMVVKLEALLAGEREVWKGVTPAANTPLNEVVLIATPEVMTDVRYPSLSYFYNIAGTNARGYKFHEGDIFSVSDDAIDGTATVGHVVELQAGIKMKDVASATSGSTVIGKVIQIETVGTVKYVVIEVRPAVAGE